jgi:putative methionine-R-sulfoxide reductase with GAF domain
MPDSDDNLLMAPNLLNEIDQIIQQPISPQARLDEIVALLFNRISRYTWVGIYLMDGDHLVLGPFRGKPSPHTRIPLNHGICGAAASQKQTIIVPDVTVDPRFLACSLETRSEIVVPIMDGETCLGEIDIDSDKPDAFDESDRQFLEAVANRLAPLLAPR